MRLIFFTISQRLFDKEHGWDKKQSLQNQIYILLLLPIYLGSAVLIDFNESMRVFLGVVRTTVQPPLPFLIFVSI